MSESAHKRGLGRGLSTLLGEPEAEKGARPSGNASASGARMIPIEWIRPNPVQPRRHFSADDLESLAKSIKEKGVLQPLLVRPAGDDSYEIVAGERRWRAAQKAGLHEAPVLIRELSDAEALEIAIIENVQRADLTPLEEAEAYQRLMAEFKRTQAAVADIVGKSRAHVANTLRLLSLPASVQALLTAGELSAGHARALVGVKDAQILARRVAAEGLSVRALEALLKQPAKTKSKSKGKDTDTLALEADLAASLGLEAEVLHRGERGGGELRLKYRTLEQLDDLCRRLTRA